MTFAQMELDAPILKAITELGYETPTPIQQETIPTLVKGDRDCVALAQTGTGKTAAFGLPLLHLVNSMESRAQALILAPTRELCLQICNDLKSYAKYDECKITAVYGGAPAAPQIRELRNGTQIIVATPGRLIDYIEKGIVDLREIERIILDEADEMLNMGFLDDINFILKNAENKSTVWMFSATMPSAIRNITKKFMNKPLEIAVSIANSTNKNIDHQYFLTSPQDRMAALKRIIDFTPEMYGIIFTRTKNDAKYIVDMLLKDGYASDALHGDLDQKQRDTVMKRFREASLKLLIATDVAARGIDITGITHVINFELPEDPEVYTHRSGRTARAGAEGICMSIVSNREIEKIRRIEKICQTKFNRRDIPSASDVLRKKLFYITDGLLKENEIPKALESYKEYVAEQLVDTDKETLLMKFLALSLKEDFKKYNHAKDLNATDYRNSERKTTGNRVSIFINVGTKDGFNENSFKEFIQDLTDVSKDLIYRVHLKELVAFFDIDSETSEYVLETLNRQKLKNRKIRVDISEKQGSRDKGRNFAGSRNSKNRTNESSRPKYNKRY